MAVHVTRLPIQLLPDKSRVITRFFRPGEENRIREIVERLLVLSDEQAETLLTGLKSSFGSIHPDLDDVFLEHYELVRHCVPKGGAVSPALRRLVGACFTMEYAVESAALFNPSMVPAIDQSGVPAGSVRFAMSLRATGEGHVSSIVFRRGIVDAEGGVRVDPPGRHSRALNAVTPDHFEKADFVRQLRSIGAWNKRAKATLSKLPKRFTTAQLSNAIDERRANRKVSGKLEESHDALLALTRANYRLTVPKGGDLSELVIFPFSDNERHGIEDLRLVRFGRADGSHIYYGTYTAYNGFRIFPQLLEFEDAQTVEVRVLRGRCAKNKGMALFPQKIDDKYAMIARLDNENLYYMESDDVLVWEQAHLLQSPKYPWEVIQIGNCGSPLKTDAGWLLLTHGVGPLRQYCIGATLLDFENPRHVIGRTSEPLLVPLENERFGYVPNVVYSCGGMIHAGKLILPYAMNDLYTSIAVIDVDELLETIE